MAYDGNFRENIFVGVPRRARRGALAAAAREIVGDAVDLVEQALPLLRPISMFRHDRVLVLVEPVDHLDQGTRPP